MGGEWRTQGKGPHDDVEVRVAYGLFSTPVLTQFMSGVELTDMLCSKVGDQWRIILKGRRKKRKLIAFFYCDTWRDLFVEMVTSVDIGYVRWFDERPPPWQRS